MSFQDAIRRLLPRNRFARNVSILAGGTAAGQLVVVLVAPLLTRLYGPEDFGLLAAFVALLSILAVIVSLRYQLAIPLPEDDLKAAHVVALCLLIVLGVTLFSAGIVFFFSGAIAEALNLPFLASYLWLLPVGLLLVGAYDVFGYWAIRTKAFPAIARTKLTQALAMVAVQLGGFFLGPFALLLGQVTGHAAGATSLGKLAIHRRWSLFRHVRPAGIARMALRYRRFPIFSSWGAVFNTLSAQLPPLLFAALFGPVVAGLYALAQRVLAMPMSLVGRAIGDVFFVDAADARRSGTLAPLVAGVHERLAQIAMPPALLLLLVGPDLFAFVFGEDWRQAGVFAQWMAPWLYLQFVSSPLSMVFDVLEKQPQDLAFQGTLLAVRLSVLLLGAWTGEFIHTVALFALGSALCYFGLLCWIFILSNNRWAALWQPSARVLAWSALLVSPLGLAMVFAAPPLIWLGSAALVAMLLCARYLALLRAAW